MTILAETIDTGVRRGFVRAIAFHLPQFHPIPENDGWWGKGFTEWTNVVKARPLFSGHCQPDLPAELGFYDLRLPEARAAQAELAAQHGIHGFCYYHYWFEGRRLLERPLDAILRSGRPDFPFCLCWANESWTRGWLGQDREILIQQTYDADDDLEHARWLAKAFADDRYVRKNGRAIFLVYRPGDLPSPNHLTDTLRAVCMKNGDKDPYLIGVDAHQPGRDFRKDGFDATLAFEPQLGVLPEAFHDAFSVRKLWRNFQLRVTNGELKIYDYTESRMRMLSLVRQHPTIPCVFVGWDNTPRRGPNGLIVVNSTPAAFGHALEEEIAKLRASSDSDPILFINGWNEWAEGNHLEPCQRWGRKRLEAARRVLGDHNRIVDGLIGGSERFPSSTNPTLTITVGGTADDAESMERTIRAIAFHLPQFHPIPENDEWWGKGFTEWTKVVTAQPRFPGHYQPHLPADLGFYDLRLPEARSAQAELAASHGIHGFCYYHYWFHGRRLLERPVNEIWKSGEPDFPFCLCWANENWTRKWDGLKSNILLEQKYSEVDDLEHIRSLIPIFCDRRYIRILDRPMFLVYRAKQLPEPKRTADAWREEAQRVGLKGLYLVRVESFGDEYGDPRSIGFDSSVVFHPCWSLVENFRIFRRRWWHRTRLGTNELGVVDNRLFNYEGYVRNALSTEDPGYLQIPCVFPDWDNSPRRNHGATISVNSTPEIYEQWLREVVNRRQARIVRTKGSDVTEESLVFINAWNEWAEGCHLEPCQRWGRKYLEATQRALGASPNQSVG